MNRPIRLIKGGMEGIYNQLGEIIDYIRDQNEDNHSFCCSVCEEVIEKLDSLQYDLTMPIFATLERE